MSTDEEQISALYRNARALQAERDELQRRIDRVLALGRKGLPVTFWGCGWDQCLEEIKAILAPKPEPRFEAKRYAKDDHWIVTTTRKYETWAQFYGDNAEAHAKAFCDLLNAQAAQNPVRASE